MKRRISIQGFEGSFHQMAAQSFFKEEIDIIPCTTFKEVVELAANTQQSNGGVMAIENSIAGSILPNYKLLQKANIQIAGEIYLQINQHLMVNPGVSFNDIKEVHSHPMALQQCQNFLDDHKWKQVETEDTALSAKHIRRHNSKHVAAIAGSLAAELFQLQILAPAIQDEKNNYTRFLVLEPLNGVYHLENANKASIQFQVKHQKGSLAKILTEIAKYGINLSKLQSVPIPGSNWKYNFYADLEFEDIKRFETAHEKINKLAETVKVFGIYKKGKTIK
jgi:prephenate dehydratase